MEQREQESGWIIGQIPLLASSMETGKPNMEWRDRDLTTTKEERKVKKRIKESQGHFKLYFDKKRRLHNIKTEDWVRVSKKRFKHGFFHNDQKVTLNSKYSRPAKVLKVVKGMTTLWANKDFKNNTRVNVNDLRKIRFWDKEVKMTLKQEESGEESITA
jgi:hypothetical protein